MRTNQYLAAALFGASIAPGAFAAPPAAPAPAAPAPAAPAPAAPAATATPAPAGAPTEPVAAAPAPAPSEPEAAAPAAESPPAPAPAAEPSAPPPLAGPAAAPAPTATPKAAAPARPNGRTPGAEDYEKSTPPDAASLTEVKEQPKLNVALTWNVTMPFGKTQDFASAVSLQGFSIELRYRLNGNYQVGALIGWASLSEKVASTSSENGVTVTGTELHELSVNPLALRGHYLFGAAPLIGPNGRPAEAKLRPFVALGAGAARTLMTVDKGIGSDSAEAWQFALLPEVGVIYPLAPADILVGARIGYLAPSGAIGEQTFGQITAGAALE